MEKLKKIITMIMVMVLTIGNMPIAVLADETTNNDEANAVSSVTVGNLNNEGE